MNKTLPALPGKAPALPATISRQSLQRHERSTLWFQLYRRGART